MATFTAEIDVDIDDFLEELDHDQKIELLEKVSEELNLSYELEKLQHDKRALMMEYFRSLSDDDKRKFLCDALYVPNYYDNESLKVGLEPIFNAQ